MEAQTMEEKLGKSYAGLTKVCFVGHSKLCTLFFIKMLLQLKQTKYATINHISMYVLFNMEIVC